MRPIENISEKKGDISGKKSITSEKKTTKENKINKRNNISPGGESKEFKRFWAEYPKKVAKPAALKAFAKINPNPSLLKIRLMDKRDYSNATSSWQNTRKKKLRR